MKRQIVPIPELTPELKTRFLSRLKQETSGCLVWTGARSQAGYGGFKAFGVMFKAHRIAYAIEHGECPPALLILHSCDNPPCCNPAHLRAGTNSQNMLDMSGRGRWNSPRGNAHFSRAKPEKVLKGTAVGTAKLTDDKVRQIRVMSGTLRQWEIAKSFGVSQSLVSMITKRKIWAHLP